MSKRRVLVFPAGTEIGLEIQKSLQYCKEIELFGAGENISTHARFVYKEYFNLPSIYSGIGWLEELIQLCGKLQINYIFPAYDDVIVELAKYRNKIPATILAPSLDAVTITRSKSKTYERLKSMVPVPTIYEGSGEIDFPVIVKPDCGQGAQGVCLVDDENSLRIALNKVEKGIICEYLPGEEFTVDCFSDRDRGLLFCGARRRVRMRNGIAVHTETIELPGAYKIGETIARELGLYGAWFFQVKYSRQNKLTLLEVGPRIAGSMSAHRVKGVNFPLLTIFESERLPLEIVVNSHNIELGRALGNRYKVQISFKTLYIDLDDTLIINGELNLDAVKLIFQCINQGICVELITRHNGDLDVTLQKFRINNLFDRIHHLNATQSKADFIVERNSIFVDDSFSERIDVHQKIGIPTFDCSMIESLIENNYPNNE